jgi:hypothetical protein
MALVSRFRIRSYLQGDELRKLRIVEIKLPPAKPEVYCLSASKALVTHEPPEGGYSPNFIWS